MSDGVILMPKFKDKPIAGNISRFRLQLQKTDNYDLAGSLYNDYYGFAIDFSGVRYLLSILDEFFDYVNFPQAGNKKRSFAAEKNKSAEGLSFMLRDIKPEEQLQADTDDYIILHVQFRQYSSWQGILQWPKEKKTLRFRSELELVQLLANLI